MSRIKPFHHGDLKSQLVIAAQSFIEAEGVERMSLREIARLAGVSTAAPYRHYATREALLADVAAKGFAELSCHLMGAAKPLRSNSETILRQCVAYVQFAQANPALYRLMFGGLFNKENHPHLKQAGDETFAILRSHFPKSDDLSQEMGCWSVVHGLAFLVIDRLLVHRDIVPTSAYLRKVLAPFLPLWSENDT